MWKPRRDELAQLNLQQKIQGASGPNLLLFIKAANDRPTQAQPTLKICPGYGYEHPGVVARSDWLRGPPVTACPPHHRGMTGHCDALVIACWFGYSEADLPWFST